MPPKAKGADPEMIAAAQALADSNKPAAGDDDQSEQVALQESALEKLGQTINDADLATQTLIGDVTDTILELFKRRPKPWSACSPQEQREVAKVAQFAAKELVNQVVTLVASANRPAIRAVLDGITVSDKITGKFKLAPLAEDRMAETLAELYHANRKTILIITADAGEYDGAKGDPVDPEEPEMNFAGDIGGGDGPDDEGDPDLDRDDGLEDDNDDHAESEEEAETIN